MTTNHDAVAALPIPGNVDKTLVRNLVTKRMPYVLADADDVTGLVAVDPATGAAIIDMLFLGRVFHYDPTDTTTANDGVSCLVSSDGRRYKLSSSSDVFAFAVLDNTHATPPVSPAIGDAYLIAAAATGAWAGKSNFVTVFTKRGWEFINFGIGRLVYVEAIDSYYHKNAGGSWVTGFGGQIYAASSVPLSAAINFGRNVIVENQTTTAPPGSPTVGTAYIIGASATGGWAGQDGRIAICEVAGSFAVYTPGNGWSAYDKSQNNTYVFGGLSWAPAGGALLKFRRVYVEASTALTSQGSVYYTYSPSSGPGATNFRRVSGQTLNWTAASVNNYLRFKISADPTWLLTAGTGAASSAAVIGIYVDSEASPRAWAKLSDFAATNDIPSDLSHELIIAAPDTLPHAYHFEITLGRSTSTWSSFEVSAMSRCTITLEELVPS